VAFGLIFGVVVAMFLQKAVAVKSTASARLTLLSWQASWLCWRSSPWLPAPSLPVAPCASTPWSPCDLNKQPSLRGRNGPNDSFLSGAFREGGDDRPYLSGSPVTIHAGEMTLCVKGPIAPNWRSKVSTKMTQKDQGEIVLDVFPEAVMRFAQGEKEEVKLALGRQE